MGKRLGIGKSKNAQQPTAPSTTFGSNWNPAEPTNALSSTSNEAAPAPSLSTDNKRMTL